MGRAWTGVIWLVADARGVTDAMTSGAWQSFGLTGLRGLGLVLAAGLVGFALASIGRHIAAALGSAVAAVVVGVVGVDIVVAMLGVKFPLAWVWTTYIEAWLNKVSWCWRTGTSAPSPPSRCATRSMLEITWQTSGLLMAGLVACARRRGDVADAAPATSPEASLTPLKWLRWRGGRGMLAAMALPGPRVEPSTAGGSRSG